MSGFFLSPTRFLKKEGPFDKCFYIIFNTHLLIDVTQNFKYECQIELVETCLATRLPSRTSG